LLILIGEYHGDTNEENFNEQSARKFVNKTFRSKSLAL
jgi:hypothetical protein